MTYIRCALNGCGEPAQLLDDESRLPMCWDCFDEIDSMRTAEPVSLWDAAASGVKLGLLVGGLYSIGTGW